MANLLFQPNHFQKSTIILDFNRIQKSVLNLKVLGIYNCTSREKAMASDRNPTGAHSMLEGPLMSNETEIVL